MSCPSWIQHRPTEVTGGRVGRSTLNHATKCHKPCFPLWARVTPRARCVRERTSWRREGQKEEERQGKLAVGGQGLHSRGEGRQQGRAPKKHGHATGLGHPKAALRQLPAIRASFGKASLTAGGKNTTIRSESQVTW